MVAGIRDDKKELGKKITSIIADLCGFIIHGWEREEIEWEFFFFRIEREREREREGKDSVWSMFKFFYCLKSE